MNQSWFDLAKRSDQPASSWLLGDPFQHLPQLGRFNTVVSAPPFGMPRERRRIEIDGEDIELSDNRERLLMVEAALHLTDDGVAIYLVPNGFFFQRTSVWHRLAEFGLHARAVISPSVAEPGAVDSIAANALVLDHEPHEQLFIGQVELANLAELITNLRAGQEGSRPELGRLIPPGEFHGFAAHAEEERLETWARRSGSSATDTRERSAKSSTSTGSSMASPMPRTPSTFQWSGFPASRQRQT